MRKLIGTWNPTRGLWETGVIDLLSEHSEPFSETWPTWGMTRSGVAFELPTRVPLMDVSESSSSPILATPRTSDTNGPGHHGNGGMDLRTQVSLLPTPTVVDMGRNKTVEEWEAWTGKMRSLHGNGNGHGASLEIEAQKLTGPVSRPQSDDGNDSLVA